ncbi:MAG: ABC transporter substrate-binding protein [Oscillospiraceae bacterium]|jgi:iron complex transport system substrate-binding protein|nr:ABC transporter substrate-binding protein [Oscillospiraceae bacterium]
MKHARLTAVLSAIAVFIAMFAGCAANSDSPPTPSPATPSSAEATTATAAPAKTELGIKYAKNFKINYLADGVKLVTDSDNRTLLLTPKGVTAPAGYDDAVQVETPVSNSMFTSTTYVGYLGALEDDSVFDSIAAVCTPREDWTTKQVIDRFASGKIKYVEQSHWNAGDIEDIVGIRPDLVFSGGGDDAGMQLRALLDEVNIKYATLMDYTEEGAEANLEWIKFFAAFYNLDEQADRLFNEKIAYLGELEAKVAETSIDSRPLVAYGLVYDGTVYTQSGSSTLAEQIEKSGGIYALKDLEGTGSITITMEEFLNKCRNADIVIYGSLPQYCPDKAYLLETEPLFAEFDAFKNDNIYIFDRGYYMNSAKVIEKYEDQVFMFQSSLLPEHALTMYQKLS